ncbi:MAG: exo-alpha-sialidase [Bryobacterales bacterium]|nr:exo-alpha-sialidase [Bryobacterales bacterium]
MMIRALAVSVMAAGVLGGQVQRVEGFGAIVFAHNNHTSATIRSGRDFRGPAPGYMTAGWWAPGQLKDNRLEWDTAACPEKKDTVFVFVGASSPLPPEVATGPELKLSVNGNYALTFRIGLLRDWSWSGNGVRLRYRAVRNEWTSWSRQRQFEVEGNSGVYELQVPAGMVTAGKPVRVKVEMQPYPRWPNGWFMVKERPDAQSQSTEELRQEVQQLRTDVNRLAELVHTLTVRQNRVESGDSRFEHTVAHAAGRRHLHPADMVSLKDGSILLTAREATEHVARDGDMVILRSGDQGRTWTQHSRIGLPKLDEREACGLQLADGSILLVVYYNDLYRDDDEYEQKWMEKTALGKGKQYLGAYTVRSRDGGKTWSEPKYIPATGMPFTDTEGPADAMVQMPDGALLLPLIGYNVGGDVRNLAAVLLRSIDEGESWQYYATVATDPGGKLGQFAETGLVLLKSGTLLAAMRNQTGFVWMAKSKDGGKTWTQPTPSPLVGHPADLTQLADGRVLCTYGFREPYHGTPSGVRAAFSEDEGETWKVEEEVVIRGDLLNWDVGYPESLQLSDGRILTVYYYNLLGRYFLGASFWKL